MKKPVPISRKFKDIHFVYTLLAVIAVLLIVVLSIMGRKSPEDMAVAVPEATPTPGVIETATPTPVPRKTPSPEKTPSPAVTEEVVKPVRKGTLYFVIDDVGYHRENLEKFLAFPGKITLAVLPGLGGTKSSARRIREVGKAVILHFPMEPKSGIHPGPGGIIETMSNEEISDIFLDNLVELGNVKGFNNHMGSKITANERIMDHLLKLSKEKGLYFLDSYTTSDSVGARMAQKYGVPFMKRDVFLDNEMDRKYLLGQIKKGLEIADNKGYAVMIGHEKTMALAELLIELYPILTNEGYKFSDISDLIQ